jgi:hypothetical protein
VPALNVRPRCNVQFTGAGLGRVRAAAARAGQALKPPAHDASLPAASDRAGRVAEAFEEAFEYVTARSSELNRRLATIYLERDDIAAGGGIACGFPLRN